MRLGSIRWERTEAPSIAMADAAVALPLNVETVQAERLVLDPALTAHDGAVFLLHVAAEVEHALMAQYLYAAWSLGGPQIPASRRDEVEQWRRTILQIARQEMAHLLTVQNILLLLGGPPNFEREDYPFRSDLYPF